jgi:ubiquinone/menaquinone biosynthesis C-methylase UbiE
VAGRDDHAGRQFSLGKPADAADFILQRRYRLVRNHAPTLGGALLDYGCGNGAQTLLFRDDFDRIIGADVVLESIVQFEQRLEDDRAGSMVTPTHYDGRLLPVADDSIDAIVSFEVLEHVADEASSLADMWRVLRPGGWVAMTVPNRWWIFETHGADLPLLPWNRVPFFSWLPKRLHDRWARARIYRRREIVRLLAAAGFEVLDAMYVMAPLDVLRWRPLQGFLRRTLFRADVTPIAMQATAILVLAHKPNLDRFEGSRSSA